jgi:phosphatidylserine/phosphatidylglycerophosphate/cardiolipin synthase-like enzyme
VNETLRRALADARKNEVDVSSALGVDPKTVQRWLAGRVPLRAHRWALADLVGQHEYDLWPALAHGDSSPACPEIQTVYPHRGAVPREVWRQLFESARREIGILVYAGLFLAEDVDLLRVFADRARSGVAVRVLLGDPDSPEVAQRGAEEGIDDAISAKIRNTIVLYRPLLQEDTVEIRLHRTVLYNSIYRADDEMLVNPHVFGAAAAYAPMLHLRQAAPGDLVTTYLASFERVWDGAVVLT